MDNELKNDILRDVDEFLDQDMQDWLAERASRGFGNDSELLVIRRKVGKVNITII